MKLLDTQALSAALRFPRRNPIVYAAGSLVYAVPFALQNLTQVYVAGGSGLAGWLTLILLLAAYTGFAAALAGWGRRALGLAGSGQYGLSLGEDELRLFWVALLVAILLFTVLGTALVVLIFMLAALAMIGASNMGMDEPPAGYVEIFSLFGTGEWIVAIALMAAFAVFGLWLITRLSIAIPATLEGGRIRILSVWPLTSGHFGEIAGTAAVIILPALIVLALFNSAIAALFGVVPADPASVLPPSGRIEVLPLGYTLWSFVYGLLQMGLLFAPLTVMVCSLYTRYAKLHADRLEA